MKEAELRRLKAQLERGNEHDFYCSRAWRRLRDQVLAMDHNECQICAARGRYSRAEIVHHVRHLKDAPELAMSIMDPETGKRQLISVCKACHEAEHPEALRQYAAAQAQPLTEERWD